MNFFIIIVFFMSGFCFGGVCIGRRCIKRLEQRRRLADKYQTLFQLMCRWVKNSHDKIDLTAWFTERKYFHIAIYGWGEVGKRLMEELDGSMIVVDYVIEQQVGNGEDKNVKILQSCNELERVDCIVVTPIAYFDEIEELIQAKLDCPIISIEDIIYE